ncbi:MAG: HsdM family class I SAM-dependent methyltransferase [Bacteroidales bacterium]
MKKGIFNEILKSYSLNEIETHLIYYYLTTYKLDYSNNTILTKFLEDFQQNTKLYFDVFNLDISSLKDLENYLELLIPQRDRKFNGAFFTPTYIVDFIINEVKPSRFAKNLDPSCGCGAFLIGIAEYYKANFNKSIKETIRDNIFGSDILDYNISRAKLLLTIFALQNGENIDEIDFNLYVQDSLKANWTIRFDNVIGNPPYVKFQDLSDDNRKYLAKNWTTVDNGSFNLYFAFFELGYKLLNDDGKLGFITPNNYFTSLAGVSIRKYFQQKKCVTRIIDFSHNKVFDAQTYTALTFLNKQENDALTFDRIKEGYKPEDFLPIANGSPNYFRNLDYKKWRLLKTDEQKNIKQIESIGKSIVKLFDICVGIATLKDEVFFVDGSVERNGCFIKSTENGTFEIEKEITKSVYKISNFKSQKEIETNTKRIICPYIIGKGGASPISELEFKKKYPKCYAYLLSEKESLLARDKGKVTYEPFFVWGRTQGLNKLGKKILNPTFSQFPRFLLVEEEDAFFTNGYGLFFREQNKNMSLFDEPNNPISLLENIDVVQKILNSIVMHYYVSKTSVAIEGGYPCYQKNFIENFTIPEFTNEEINILRKLDNKQEIDGFLVEKYQLNILVPNLFV